MKATLTILLLLFFRLQAVKTVLPRIKIQPVPQFDEENELVNITKLTRIRLQPVPRIDVEKELARVSKLCMKNEDYQELTGNVGLAFYLAHHVCTMSMEESIETMGLQEIRSTLKFSPPGPWKPFNKTSPSEQELDEAHTPEAYYELREPKSSARASDSNWVAEKQVTDVVKYLDKHQATIRGIFKQTFEDRLVREGSTISKETVDALLWEYQNIIGKVIKAAKSMISLWNCQS